jgi:hypothetical protein
MKEKSKKRFDDFPRARQEYEFLPDNLDLSSRNPSMEERDWESEFEGRFNQDVFSWDRDKRSKA